MTSWRLRWLRAIGKFPTSARIEAQRKALQRQYERYKAFENSEQGRQYEALRSFMKSGELARVEAECATEVFAGSREEGMIEDLKMLSKLPTVRDALNGKGDTGSKDYQNYLQLKAKVDSPEFKERVAYLQDKNKFHRTEAYKKKQEFELLSKSRECKWYLKHRELGTFRALDESLLMFQDDFDEHIDPKKWAPRFFWGHAMIQKPYSFMEDQHGYTDGNNLKVENGKLHIVTRQEDFEGLAWDSKKGFLPKRFHFTSGVLTTGHSFRLKHGVFEAKIRFMSPKGVFHALYLVGDKRTPEIEVFRTNASDPRFLNAVYMPREGAAPVSEEIGPLPFSSEFFILQVEWTPEKLVWRINGMPFMEHSAQLPNEPMYLVLLSGIEGNEPIEGEGVLEVDWVRCMALPKA